LPDAAAICVECGFDLRSGRRLKTKISRASKVRKAALLAALLLVGAFVGFVGAAAIVSVPRPGSSIAGAVVGAALAIVVGLLATSGRKDASEAAKDALNIVLLVVVLALLAMAAYLSGG
jgi:hypothetical protein